MQMTKSEPVPMGSAHLVYGKFKAVTARAAAELCSAGTDEWVRRYGA